MVVQHNITAMNANRYFGINNNKLSKSLEKLSSGYAINRAGDNAAGLAVSEKMRSQIAGMTQAVKNAQDGISMVQTYEGALTETDSILQRMKTLADQAAHGSYDNEVDRSAIELEYKQLNDELNQIADTDFNGVVVLNGGVMSDGTRVTNFSKPASVGATEATSSTQDILYSDKATHAKAKVSVADNGTVTVKGLTVDRQDLELDADKKVVAGQDVTIGGFTGKTEVGTEAVTADKNGKITAGDVVVDVEFDVETVNKDIQINSDGAAANKKTMTQKVTINGVDYYSEAATKKADASTWYTEDGAAVKLTDVLSSAGIKVVENGDIANGKLKVKMTADLKAYDPEKEINVSQSNAFGNGRRNLTYTDSITMQVGARSKDAVKFTFEYSSEGIGNLKDDLDCSARGLGTDQLTLSTAEDANYAIDQIDNAINKVSMVRATFGAVQNRLEHKIDNMNVTIENITDAESRIRDTNMAQEMMNFTKNQILSQASQSMLAQANQLPQSVLQLLQ